MGILRFFLAASVVCTHAGHAPGFFVLAGGDAVRAFFLISGFYMTLILDSKYGSTGKARWLFYSNRILRIYPMYYATLLLCLAMYGAATVWTGRPVDRLEYWLQAAHLGAWPQLALLALAQLLIMGIETTSYFAFSPEYGFGLNLGLPGTVEGWRFCFLPQTWTVGIELIFYILAPWLVQMKKRLLVLLIVTNVAALILVPRIWGDSLTTIVVAHFFPFSLVYFLLGILAYRFFYQRPVPGLGRGVFNWAAVGLIAVLCISLEMIPAGPASDWAQVGFYIALFLAVPFLFQQTKNSLVDRLIGELSYPMYLCHLPAKWMLLSMLGRANHTHSTTVPVWMLLPLTVVLAVAMVRWIDYPVDRYRQRRANKAKAEAFPHGNPGPVAGQGN